MICQHMDAWYVSQKDEWDKLKPDPFLFNRLDSVVWAEPDHSRSAVPSIIILFFLILMMDLQKVTRTEA